MERRSVLATDLGDLGIRSPQEAPLSLSTQRSGQCSPAAGARQRPVPVRSLQTRGKDAALPGGLGETSVKIWGCPDFQTPRGHVQTVRQTAIHQTDRVRFLRSWSARRCGFLRGLAGAQAACFLPLALMRPRCSHRSGPAALSTLMRQLRCFC